MAHCGFGVTETGEIYNGAFDDATGHRSELARFFRETATTRRSLIFWLHRRRRVWSRRFRGLVGQSVPLTDVVAGISVDPVGRGLCLISGPSSS